MKAILIDRTKLPKSETSFVDTVTWLLAAPMPGSTHNYKYRLAYIVKEVCVVRLDNEAGKGDHLHFGKKESNYKFFSLDQLFSDFDKYIERWNHENNHT